MSSESHQTTSLLCGFLFLDVLSLKIPIILAKLSLRMPAGVKSLLNLSLECIVLKIRYSCFPFDKPSTNSDLAKENGLELSINPFHQLRKLKKSI